MVGMDSTQSYSNPSASHGSTSSGFLERLKGQDPRAWQQLADVYGPLVYYWCRKYGVKSNDAEDIFQEVFGSVAASIGRFHREQDGGRFRGWLWTITRRKIQDHYRNLASREEACGGTEAQQWMAALPEQLDVHTLDQDERSQHSGLFVRALEIVKEEFEDRTWQAFWQIVVDRRSTQDVAADLGISANGVRQAKSRVLRRMRVIFGELGEQTDLS
jgi:RNA polymerase sigma-70 factor (ECF subfamily)